MTFRRYPPPAPPPLISALVQCRHVEGEGCTAEYSVLSSPWHTPGVANRLIRPSAISACAMCMQAVSNISSHTEREKLDVWSLCLTVWVCSFCLGGHSVLVLVSIRMGEAFLQSIQWDLLAWENRRLHFQSRSQKQYSKRQLQMGKPSLYSRHSSFLEVVEIICLFENYIISQYLRTQWASYYVTAFEFSVCLCVTTAQISTLWHQVRHPTGGSCLCSLTEVKGHADCWHQT